MVDRQWECGEAKTKAVREWGCSSTGAGPFCWVGAVCVLGARGEVKMKEVRDWGAGSLAGSWGYWRGDQVIQGAGVLSGGPSVVRGGAGWGRRAQTKEGGGAGSLDRGRCVLPGGKAGQVVMRKGRGKEARGPQGVGGGLD